MPAAFLNSATHVCCCGVIRVVLALDTSLVIPREDDANETSPPYIPAAGRGHCHGPGRLALRLGASLSDAAGAHHRRTGRGSGSDTAARLIGQRLSERLGQQFIIENRPGAAGNIATEAAVRAPPDGHTLLLVNAGNAINATLYDKLNFNFIRDIAPVAGIFRVPQVMEVNPSVPAKTVSEFITYAKANPGKVNMDRRIMWPASYSNS
jgi:Tripartite tricarboxylate transporter family receptor